MNILFIVGGGSLLLILAYRTYGTFISKKIFDLDDTSVTPAVEMEDGLDYVPTDPKFLLGSTSRRSRLPVPSPVRSSPVLPTAGCRR